MPPIRSIAILLHERDHGAIHGQYRIWSIAENWRRRGLRVDILFGPPPSGNIDADLLIPHIDLSYIPDHLWQVIQAHPRAINRGIRDIRKTTISRVRVRRGDDYSGPVIIKTAGNCGGWADDAYDARHGPSLRQRILARLRRHPRLEPRLFPYVRTLHRYPILDSWRAVPRALWRNPRLIVERFCPERDGERYVMRMWVVLGDRALGRTLTSPDPFVKGPRSVLREMAEAPPEVRAWARGPTLDGSPCLHLDYGKIDYLMHPGPDGTPRPALIDVNWTPTVSGDARSEHYIAQNANLAEGIALWER